MVMMISPLRAALVVMAAMDTDADANVADVSACPGAVAVDFHSCSGTRVADMNAGVHADTVTSVRRASAHQRDSKNGRE